MARSPNRMQVMKMSHPTNSFFFQSNVLANVLSLVSVEQFPLPFTRVESSESTLLLMHIEEPNLLLLLCWSLETVPEAMWFWIWL